MPDSPVFRRQRTTEVKLPKMAPSNHTEIKKMPCSRFIKTRAREDRTVLSRGSVERFAFFLRKEALRMIDGMIHRSQIEFPNFTE